MRALLGSLRAHHKQEIVVVPNNDMTVDFWYLANAEKVKNNNHHRWMLRATMWMLRAMRWLLRAMRWMFGELCRVSDSLPEWYPLKNTSTLRTRIRCRD